ncbi:MAG: crosslink repair DNA glycosylase YcaQ family protein [Vicinamibacterales bacterium]
MKTLADLRHFAITRSLFPPTTLSRAIETLGFVQADPIRAPARAQDLILRPRVKGYRAGDLERKYRRLSIEEDVFINYGFVTRGLHQLMHPRSGVSPNAAGKRAAALLAFVREKGTVHPRDVDAHFAHGRVTNYWGGSSSATTHMLEALHYRGLLRVAGREGGIRLYAAREPGEGASGARIRRARVDALVDVVVAKYAPVPDVSLPFIISRLRYAVPQWRGELRNALARARQRLSQANVERHTWYWPAGEQPGETGAPEAARLLAPFDPVVWDRRRFELLWEWAYRFEAYTPEPKRKLGYYALPLLWRDLVIGWANVTFRDGVMDASLGYVAGRPPRERTFRREIDAELERFRAFLSPAG